MLLNILFILAGFFILVHGANYFVLGAASIARKLGISAIVVGLTIVAIGTSAPEFFVNVIAAYQGATDLSIGNILGSNLADILLGLGIAAIIVPLHIKKGTIWKEIPFSLLAAIFILIFGADSFISGVFPNELGRIEGIALLGFFVIFITYTFGLAKVKNGISLRDEKIEILSWFMSVGYTVGGIAALAIGGKLAVDGAVAIADIFGISQNLIGLTVVAAGTSLPEIVTAIVAARKGHIDLVVGGIVGTIIFNALFALGATAVVRPLPFSGENLIDSMVVVAATVLLFVFMFVGRKHTLERWQGYVFIAIYFVYLAYIMMRG